MLNNATIWRCPLCGVQCSNTGLLDSILAAFMSAPRSAGFNCIRVLLTVQHHYEHAKSVDCTGPSAVSGSTTSSATVNFAVRSRAATAMSLCLARTPASGKAGYMEVALDSSVNRTGDTWHICLQGLTDIDTLAYGWRADSADISQFYPGAGLGSLYHSKYNDHLYV